MAVPIRMKQMGRKHRPFYRICAIDIRRPRNGRVIEELGTYDPMVQDTDARAIFKAERVQHWLSVGAKPSDRVAYFLYQRKLGPKPAIPEQTKKNQPKAKAQERLKAAAEAAKSAEGGEAAAS